MGNVSNGPVNGDVPQGRNWRDRLSGWRYRFFFPNVRRKDAGYIASVLAEYAAFSLAERAKLPNFQLVEECVAALLAPPCREPQDAEAIRLRQVRHHVFAAAEPDQPLIVPDPIPDRVWLQGYMRQIFIVEQAVLDLQGLQALIARSPLLLERFRTVAGMSADYLKRQYDQELSSENMNKLWKTCQTASAEDIGKEADKWLRPKLKSLLNEIHWWYAQGQVREELFLAQQLRLLVTFLAGALVLFLVFWRLCDDGGDKVSVTVMFFGMLGAFISVMRRMCGDGARPGAGSSYKELTALAYGWLGISMSLVFGMVFALVLMLLFYGGLTGMVFNAKIAEVLFPGLPLAVGDGDCAMSCVLGLTPESSIQFGKLLVWSFIAGFAEQLVPDVLGRLAKAAGKK